MKPFRKNLAIAIDGGGIKGIIVTRALSILEDYIGKPLHSLARLTAGTSTGSIIASGISAKLTATRMFELYCNLGPEIFRKTWRVRLWPLTRYRYPLEPIANALQNEIGDLKMGDFWSGEDPRDTVITTFDLLDNRTRFIKPWKQEYQAWPVVKAVMASCCVPTYFPVVEGRYVDGGVGAYSNPCYLAAYELLFCLGWSPSETSLISLGTGRSPHSFNPDQANRLWAWQWIEPLVGAFLQSADDQQVHLVNTFFQELDFRRYQVDLNESIALDDATDISGLIHYGDELGRIILEDRIDAIQSVIPKLAPIPPSNYHIR